MSKQRKVNPVWKVLAYYLFSLEEIQIQSRNDAAMRHTPVCLSFYFSLQIFFMNLPIFFFLLQMGYHMLLG